MVDLEKKTENKENPERKALEQAVLEANALRDTLGLENFSFSDREYNDPEAKKKLEFEIEFNKTQIEGLKEKGIDQLRDMPELRKTRIDNYMGRVDEIVKSKDLREFEKNYKLSGIFKQAIYAEDAEPGIANTVLNYKTEMPAFKDEALSLATYQRKLIKAWAKDGQIENAENLLKSMADSVDKEGATKDLEEFKQNQK